MLYRHGHSYQEDGHVIFLLRRRRREEDVGGTWELQVRLKNVCHRYAESCIYLVVTSPVYVCRVDGLLAAAVDYSDYDGGTEVAAPSTRDR